MNIKDLCPKHVNYDSLRSQAKTYKGTKAEMYDLCKSREITPITNNDGVIIGGWISAHPENAMLDEIARQNFANAYGCKAESYMLECLALVRDGKELPAEDYTSYDLPNEVEIPANEVNDLNFSTIRNWLKRKYHNCLARGIIPSISQNGMVVKVSDIEWGRPLSQVEIAAL